MLHARVSNDPDGMKPTQKEYFSFRDEREVIHSECRLYHKAYSFLFSLFSRPSSPSGFRRKRNETSSTKLKDLHTKKTPRRRRRRVLILFGAGNNARRRERTMVLAGVVGGWSGVTNGAHQHERTFRLTAPPAAVDADVRIAHINPLHNTPIGFR